MSRPRDDGSSSDEEDEGPRHMIPKHRPDSEDEREDPFAPSSQATAKDGDKKQARMEWFFRGMTNGKQQVVPCPFVSNDLAALKISQPVKMEDDQGNLLVRSVSEKDNPDEPDDVIIGRWTSGVTDTVIDIKQFEWNKLGLDFTVVLYGKRRTGKTHFIKALSYQFRRYFPTVIVFTKTKFNGDLLKIFPDAYIYNDMDEATLERILDAQKAFVGNVKSGPQPWVNARMLLVFDDVLSDKKNPRYNEMLRKMFFEGRHFWISMVITSQDSKGLPPGLKQNTDLSVILPMAARRDRETLADNTLPFLWNDKDCREFLRLTMSIKHNFLAVINCRGAKPLSDQVYLGIITPESRIPRYVMGSFPCWKNDLEQLDKLGFSYLAQDARLEAWNIETHMPPKIDEDDRRDGMGDKPLDEEEEYRAMARKRRKISSDHHKEGEQETPTRPLKPTTRPLSASRYTSMYIQ